jgi:N-acetylglucosaminyl-diphospho-decaprenol L-rhamnosyltransferase
VDWVTAAAIWIRREAFAALGGFDEEIFMYYEDVDLCYRARSAGEVCMYYPVGAITHFRNKAPTSKDRKQLQRNWLRHFGDKHYRAWHQSPTRLAFSGLCWISRAR